MSCSSVAPRWRATWPRVQRCYETQLLRWASTDASTHKTQDLRNRKARHFIDKLIVEVQAGHGGDGCVSFHREKFVQKGPAAGGNGGNGGSVYIRCDPTVHSLARVHKRTAAKNGTHGEGDWLHGRRGEDVTIHVPVGTTVRSLGRTLNDRAAAAEPYLRHILSTHGRRRAIDPWEDPELAASRSAVWRHFPRFEDDNYLREHFAAAEDKLVREIAAQRRILARCSWDKRSAASQSSETSIEPSQVTDITADAGWSVDMAVATPPDMPGYLLARGGDGGLGNPHFLLERYHAPKIATRGMSGESLLLSLEYKQTSDVGFVGLPNAGKSTLLRCLSRADAEVGSYSFTTLRPNLGVMRVGQDGSVLDASDGDEPEMLRLTIADLPGLVKDASRNRGLGLDFLRHVERCGTLVYVVDMSPSNLLPSGDVETLNKELETYREGLSARVAMIVANKADLLGDGDQSTVAAAHEKLGQLRSDVAKIFGDRHVPVFPISAKLHLNVDKMAGMLHRLVAQSTSP